MTDQAELLERMRPWLRTVARSLLAAHEQSYAEDLASEGWVAAWRAMATDRGNTPLDWWCKRQALFKMRNARRDLLLAGKQRAHLFTEDVAELVDLATHLGDVELAYHHGRIHEALNALTRRRGDTGRPPDARRKEYVVRRFWFGQPPADIAQAMGVSDRKAFEMWRSARTALAEDLADLA